MTQKNDLIKLTGLWKKSGKTGVYLSGKLGPFSRLLILPNTRKRNENDPDYIMWIAPDQKQTNKTDQGQTSPALDALMNVNDKDVITSGRKQAGESVMKQVAEAKNKGNEGDDSDMPF